MLDPDCEFKHLYPYRLKFCRWNAGKPADKYKLKAKSWGRALAVKHAYEAQTNKKQSNFKAKWEAAIAQVMAQAGKSRSTLMNDLAAANITCPKK